MVAPVNDLPSAFGLLEPSDSAPVADYPAIIFSWEESIDEVEADTVTYALMLTFNDEDRWYPNIEATSIVICCEVLSIDPNIETSLVWNVWAYDGIDSVQCEESSHLTVVPLSVGENSYFYRPN